jgi:hypothetical protein
LPTPEGPAITKRVPRGPLRAALLVGELAEE